MPNELTYIASVENGRLKIVNRKGFDSDMADLEGKRLLLKVKLYRRSRTNKQNSYYHGCVIPYVKDGLVDMGFDRHLLSAENVHELLKNKFLKEDVGNEHGEFITVTRSTTDLTTTEFMDFIAEIQKWALTFLGIYLPDPGEQTEMEY